MGTYSRLDGLKEGEGQRMKTTSVYRSRSGCGEDVDQRVGKRIG